MNQENREINLEVESILIDYNKYLSRATEEDVIYIYIYIFFFSFFFEKELLDGSDQIYIYGLTNISKNPTSSPDFHQVVALKLFPLCKSLQYK